MPAVNNNINENNTERSTAQSLDNIREDIYALKSDVIELGRTVKSDGLKKIEDATSELQDKIDNLKSQGSNEMVRLQDYIRNNPNQSVAAAFALGAVFTFLMRR